MSGGAPAPGERPGDAPPLSVRDVEEELKALHRKERRSKNTALYGRGEPGEVSVPVVGEAVRFRIVPVRCELELRRALAADPALPAALLVDYGTDLPLDILARLAGGRVHWVTHARRLAHLFQAQTASAELLACGPLVTALLEEEGASFGPLAGSTVDLASAWGAFLYRKIALGRDAVSSEARLLAFFAGSPGGASFDAYLERRPALRAALLDQLARSAGPIAVIGLRAWLRGDGTRVAALALVLEPVVERLAREGYLRARVVGALEALDPGLRELPEQKLELLRRWAGLARPVMTFLEGSRQTEPVISLGETLVPDASLVEHFAESRWLPRAFALAREQLAAGLVEAARTGSVEAFTTARAAFERFRQHRAAQLPPNDALVERARMAVRLLAYRLSRTDTAAAARLGPAYEEVVLLAQDYVRQGGFADLARRRARGSTADLVGQAVGTVLERIDALRDADDERFARGLPAWLAAGRKADRIVPIDAALDRFAASFLDGRKERKLLVLLLDGMAWANAVELLLDLEPNHLAPIRWGSASADAEGLLPPMIAAFPTVTEVSRSSLFAGRVPKPGDRTDTGLDPDRFAEHKGLGKLPGVAPKLLLKADVQTSHGAVSAKALALVAGDERVVGLVLNAVDDQLKGSTQVRVTWGLGTIKPLGEILEAATKAGRAVLLVADHGHVPGGRMRSVGPTEKDAGARYRFLREGEEASEHEVALSGEGVWHPKTRERVALLMRESEVHGGTGAEGEHGGAALAEAVVPALLIADECLARGAGADTEDRQLEVVPLPRPRWWDLELPVAVPVVARKARPVAAIPQELPFLEQPAVSPPPVAPPPPKAAPAPGEAVAASAVRKLLWGSPLFKELSPERRLKLDREIIPQVEVLDAADGRRLAPEVFAERAKILKFRVRGAVVLLQEWLNLEGYPVIVLDDVEKQVRLDLELLQGLFTGGKR